MPLLIDALTGVLIAVFVLILVSGTATAGVVGILLALIALVTLVPGRIARRRRRRRVAPTRSALSPGAQSRGRRRG
ncbi:hypothetical protein [Conexibacter sp. DBS9H8]|uniref:hypothetical protein n=1 Tax=Conexibacter sp. DBS9H8 TaxID=2937801 RepID=UPI00200FF554|nr:hypothetical protein [Conexibacter sp. DBS9H8]